MLVCVLVCVHDECVHDECVYDECMAVWLAQHNTSTKPAP